MPSSPIPHDILCLIRNQIDPTLIGPHLLLSNVSRSFRSSLYPKEDEAWKNLLTSMGIGRSTHDLERKLIKKSKTWRQIAVKVSAREGRMLLDRITEHPHRVLSVEDVQKEKVLVVAHPQLGSDFDCHRPGSNILRFGPYRDEKKNDEKDLFVKSHPVLCHSFATVPPIEALVISGFDLAVVNREGVTQWDVRVVMNEKFPYISQIQYKKNTGRTYKEDMEYDYGSGSDKFDKKTKVKTTDFMLGPDRVFNGEIYAERGSCLFAVGSDS